MMRMIGQFLVAVGIAIIAVTPAAYAAASDNGAAAPKAAHPPTASAADANDQLLYALGVLLSSNQNLAALDLSDQELRRVLAGFRDGYQHRAHVDDPQKYLPQLQALQQSREKAVADRQLAAGAEFAAKVAALPAAHKTKSGLVYVPTVQGSGAQPGPTDRVKVQYVGKLVDGSEFDSSYKHGQPATFPLGGIIPCWKEALQLMKVGGRARVVCPSDLAYGDRGRPPVIPPGATLDFQIELLDVVAPTAPAVAVPSARAPAHSATSGNEASGSSPPPR